MGAVPRQHAGRTNTRPSREYPGLASTRSPTYAHRQRRRSAGALHPGGACSLGTSSTSSMGAVPGSTTDEPVLVPPGNQNEQPNSQVSTFFTLRNIVAPSSWCYNDGHVILDVTASWRSL